ncbi:MAG: hypothetical protein QNJ74_01685 [Trichodesmium sp. MO_231.B1]|nr:hypothetical protein [Trichodesmium sp. MO_231.B1]
MSSLPPEIQNQNQLSSSYRDSVTGQDEQNDNYEKWQISLKAFQTEYRNDCFSWLLKIFGIPEKKDQEEEQINELQNAIKNPKNFLETFLKIYKENLNLGENYQKLEKHSRLLEEKNRSLNNNPRNQKNSILSKEKQELKNLVNYLKQENKSQAIQFQTRIDELEKENQELRQSKSSLLSRLNARDRDKSSTITSNDSHRQRDILAQEFIQLNTQEITGLGNEIFNHLSHINSDLKANRKREVARIKSVFSQHIFGEGSKYFTADNSIEEDKFPNAVEDLTNSILTDLQIPETAKIPEPIRTNLKNLVEKGLKLVKEIVNDDPPGHFLIAQQGEAFNPEQHEPVPGCKSSGKIVYTTYPGYCVNNRIIGEALKVFVFTEPKEEASPERQKPFETNQTNQQANSTDNEEQHSTDKEPEQKSDTETKLGQKI